MSSNLHPSGFDEIMPKTIATATVDRLLHHAHVVITQGDSPPAHRSHHRTRRRPPHLTNPTRGENLSTRGNPLSTSGEINCPPLGRSHCPLTPRQTGELTRRFRNAAATRLAPRPAQE